MLLPSDELLVVKAMYKLSSDPHAAVLFGGSLVLLPTNAADTYLLLPVILYTMCTDLRLTADPIVTDDDSVPSATRTNISERPLLPLPVERCHPDGTSKKVVLVVAPLTSIKSKSPLLMVEGRVTDAVVVALLFWLVVMDSTVGNVTEHHHQLLWPLMILLGE